MSRDIIDLAKEITVGEETFCPILELSEIALCDIFGENAGEYIDPMVEVHHEGDTAFGVICFYCDERYGFTLNLEDGWKEFKLTSDEGKSVFKLDQLKLFDLIRKWGFDI